MVSSMRKQPSSERAHFEILLEEVRDELKRVAEGHALLDRKIEERVASLDHKIDQRGNLLEKAVLTGFEDLRRDLQQLREQVIQLDRKLEIHEKAHLSG